MALIELYDADETVVPLGAFVAVKSPFVYTDSHRSYCMPVALT